MAETAQDSTVPLRGGDDKLKDEDLEDVEYSPFYGIEKGAVLQEARIFNQPNLDPRKCQQVITKLLYLQHQGEPFTQKEQLDVFLSVTKLFSNADVNLRRMMYLCMKELCPDAPEVMIVINSLTKDMNAPQELYRANAIRVLRKMLDPSMLQQIERYFKQCIVDKSPVVAASALVAGLHMFGANAEVVKRWTSEISQAVQSKHAMVQYHAIALQTAVRSGDRLAISKILSSLTSGAVRSPMAQCLVIKYIARVLKDTAAPTGGEKRPFFDYLLTSLRDRSDMVTFQAARTICELKDVSNAELSPAISALQLYLSNGKSIVRFAAVRILNAVSMTQPVAVATCNNELETLITDTNRSIAVYAITTLLKTGSEASVDRVLKQMRTFMADIPDDFKVVVVDAIRALCLKFPAKNRALLSFLAHMLREEGGYEFKRAIVDALLVLMHAIADVREAALLHLAEFIEDCEFTPLATQVLHLLGEMAPDTADPARFVRFIYNRIVLENATVRAAATAALAAICARCEPLRDRIITILQRSLADNDDEVRDRCTLYLAHLEGKAGEPANVKPRLDVPLANLERDLHAYLAGDLEADFDVDAVDRVVPEAEAPPTKKGKRPVTEEAAPPAPTDADTEELGKEVEAMPQFKALGPRFQTCKPVMLTEEGLEYVVHCVKHVFDCHVVLQFDCTNTFKEQVLEEVTMDIDLADLEEFESCPELTVPLKRMPHTSAGATFAVLKREEGALAAGTAAVVMRFTQKGRDVATGEVEDEGYEEEYQLEEDLEIAATDYIKPVPVRNFKAAWDELDPESEVSDTYALGAETGGVPSAVEAMIAHMGMYVAEGTDLVVPNARSHMLMLSGELCGGHKALLRISFGLDAKGGVAIKVVTRAADADISEVLGQIVQSM